MSKQTRTMDHVLTNATRAAARRPVRILGALIVVTLCALASLVTAGEIADSRAESERWIDGHRPHPSLLVVRFQRAAAPEARDRLTRRLGLDERRASVNPYDLGVYEAPVNLRDAETSLRRASIVVDSGPAWIDPDGNLRHFVPGELTVQFESDVDPAAAEKIIRSFGSRIVKRQRTPGYYTITVPDGMDWKGAVRAFEVEASVSFAEPAEIGFDDAFLIPNDPLFGDQWHHQNTGQVGNPPGGTPGADIRSPAAWDVTLGSPYVVIAIIDTGVDLGHLDLAPNLLPRGNADWDFSHRGRKEPNDTDGHGTEVAGAAAARGENGIGVAGACPLCSIMPLKVDLGVGAISNRVDAINYLVATAQADPQRRYVGNCSWGSGLSKAMNRAIQLAYDNDVPLFFATGNEGAASIAYPASAPLTIAVGATSRCDERVSATSCDGEEGWGSNYGVGLDLVAPGAKILTTCLRGGPDITCTPSGGYLRGSGTSLASPIAAGVAGLLLSADRGLNAGQVQSLLEAGADDMVGPLGEDPPGEDIWMGWGRLNAERALQSIGSCPGSGQCPAPNCQQTVPGECTEHDSGITTCVDGSGVFSCPWGQTIWITNCACSAVAPGYICPNQNQWWECR